MHLIARPHRARRAASTLIAAAGLCLTSGALAQDDPKLEQALKAAEAAATGEKSIQDQETAAKSQLENQGRRIAELDDDISDRQDAIGSIQNQIFDLNERLEQGNVEDPIDTEDQIASLQADLEGLEAERDQLRAQKDRLIQATADNASELERLRQAAIDRLRESSEPAPNRAGGDRATTDGLWTYGPFAEPVDLILILDTIFAELDLYYITTDNGLAEAQVVIPRQIAVDRDHLLKFSVMLLAGKGYTLELGGWGGYEIKPDATINPTPSTMKVIPTRGLRASTLQPLINAIARNGGNATLFMDDLGMIVVTGTASQIDSIESIIDRISVASEDVDWARFDLRHVTASFARDRILELFGGTGRPVAGQPGGGAATAPGNTIIDLPNKLTLDAQSNALIFRGRSSEHERLESIIEIVDRPNVLESRWYSVGGTIASRIAESGEREGLGSVTVDAGAGGRNAAFAQRAPQQNAQLNRGGSQGGPGFSVYPEQGGFIYTGTDQQHVRVDALVEDFKFLEQGDVVIYEFYKLKHSNAADVAGVIQNLIANTAQTGNTGLLGQDLSRRNQPTPTGDGTQNTPSTAEVGDGIGEIELTEDINVIADEQNNQIIVKAPRKLQSQFERLIDKLDLKRPQVYVEAMIVTVTHDDTFRFAVETQDIFGQFGVQTLFGLSTAGAGFLDPRAVQTGLGGMTAALVRSDDIPFIINAIATDTDTRLVATPSLLVDDNEEATITSIEQQPTTTTTQGDATTQTAFGGFEDAGPELTITPHISEGGYVRLEYSITLSSFIGTSSAAGVPPPRLENEVTADSVRVPSDSTIVVGGLTFETKQDTISKIPFLGDIPIIGHAFRDTNKTNSLTTLYVFITPKIMRDENFDDLRLLTKGPAAQVGIETGLPMPTPVPMRLSGSTDDLGLMGPGE